MIVTERLKLRPITAEDADFIAKEISRPEVQCWLPSVPHPYSLEHAQKFTEIAARKLGFRMIERDGGAQGVVTISDPQDGFPLPTLGYWLCPAAHGKGYMTEAVRAMIDWQFTRDDSDIGSGWLTGNAGSENVLTKLGFTRNGIIKILHVPLLGKELPVIKVSLSKAQWETRKRLSLK